MFFSLIDLPSVIVAEKRLSALFFLYDFEMFSSTSSLFIPFFPFCVVMKYAVMQIEYIYNFDIFYTILTLIPYFVKWGYGYNYTIYIKFKLHKIQI